MIERLDTVEAARQRCSAWVRDGLTIGFVPTMGALHTGHISLVERAGSENDRVILSIYVNPTQYDDPDDLRNYPRPLEDDIAAAEDAGVDAVFLPDDGQIYPEGYRFRVSENSVSRTLEGAHRDGHFDGVLTVVMKLFGIVRPNRAYFGEKDWQQLQLVREMAAAFFLDLDVVSCPVVREKDGLAMSSRNVHLNRTQRRLAPELHRLLASGKPETVIRSALEERGFEVDYIHRDGDRMLGAVRLGNVRLIDNVKT